VRSVGGLCFVSCLSFFLCICKSLCTYILYVFFLVCGGWVLLCEFTRKYSRIHYLRRTSNNYSRIHRICDFSIFLFSVSGLCFVSSRVNIHVYIIWGAHLIIIHVNNYSRIHRFFYFSWAGFALWVRAYIACCAHMYVCMHVFVYVCIDVNVYVCVCLCVELCTNVCTHVCMYVCIRVYVYVWVCVCIDVCMHICMHIYVCVWI